jgi:ABC-2 type transport system ATP-binding protein
MHEPILTVKDLTKIYTHKRHHLAVDNISFDLKEKEILGFLGPNGSGKTTTIQMLLGTLLPTSGSIFYFGKNFLKNRSSALNQIAYASAYTSLPWTLTLKENLITFGFLYGFDANETKKRCEPLLKRFGMWQLFDSPVSSLSAGQITRLMLVKAFFTGPKIVLLDEPTASLDPDIAKEICDFILEQRKEKGVSILFTSHKMDEAAFLCDRILFLKNGKIIANDKPKNLTKSITTFCVKLVIIDGIKRIKHLLEEQKVNFSIDHKLVEAQIEEEKIPQFLSQLANLNIQYSNIKIEEPSLEDFFLQMSRKS